MRVLGPRGVQAGGVSIRRVLRGAVELHIKEITIAEDAGVYECYTPSTDSKYLGSYGSKVELRVLPNKLSVSAASPPIAKPVLRSRGAVAASPPLPRVTLSESQELRLTCTALTETQEHTHLSVSFGVSGTEDPGGRAAAQEVIGLRRDFAVEAGGRFAERHRDHELSLAKLGHRQYQMALGWLRPEDAGLYHCTVGEWIQDPDGSWQQIAEKRVPLAQVAVRTITSQLLVSVSPSHTRVSSGEPLELLCNASGILASPLPHVAYAVSWELGKEGATEGRLVAQLDTEGAVVLGDSYANREVGQRHVSLQKLGSPPGSYRLRIESAQPGDVGTYWCVVQAYVLSPRAEPRQVATGRSEGLAVDMTPEDSGHILVAVERRIEVLILVKEASD
uniref:Uncharacterized protein n=1 Tax=Sphaerodactylus townsendi TaxID=933632 RepID=A0ACB8G6Z6_9SAUR